MNFDRICRNEEFTLGVFQLNGKLVTSQGYVLIGIERPVSVIRKAGYYGYVGGINENPIPAGSYHIELKSLGNSYAVKLGLGINDKVIPDLTPFGMSNGSKLGLLIHPGIRPSQSLGCILVNQMTPDDLKEFIEIPKSLNHAHLSNSGSVQAFRSLVSFISSNRINEMLISDVAKETSIRKSLFASSSNVYANQGKGEEVETENLESKPVVSLLTKVCLGSCVAAIAATVVSIQSMEADVSQYEAEIDAEIEKSKIEKQDSIDSFLSFGVFADHSVNAEQLDFDNTAYRLNGVYFGTLNNLVWDMWQSIYDWQTKYNAFWNDSLVSTCYWPTLNNAPRCSGRPVYRGFWTFGGQPDEVTAFKTKWGGRFLDEVSYCRHTSSFVRAYLELNKSPRVTYLTLDTGKVYSAAYDFKKI